MRMRAFVHRRRNRTIPAIHDSSFGYFRPATLLIWFVLLSCGLLLYIAWKYKGAVRRQLKVSGGDGESRFRTLAEAIPQIVWTASAEGETNYINQRWYEMTGLPHNEEISFGWMEAVHVDDRELCKRKWLECMNSGETFEIEYRLRDMAGAYRWYLDRAVPLRDGAGRILQWFGTCTDIDERMRNQQLLEEQIRERTAELFGANTKLQEEMWEKDHARKQLDEQNERMMRDLTERSSRATMLAKLGELLQSCISEDEVLAAAVGFAPKIFHSRGALALFNQRQNLEIVSSWSDCVVPLPTFERGDCWALRTGHSHFVPAADATARCPHAENVRNSYACIPIVAQGETLGLLHFQATDAHPQLTDSDISLKNTFAGQIGLSIANIRLREALRNQSILDPLTGLFNRRYLEETLEREVRRAVRSNQPLGIMMLDLDHFKTFNDTYGHEAGDVVLRQAAAFLKRCVRAEDIVCRFGGEEFVIILPSADLRVAYARAERSRCKFHDLTVLHNGKSLGLVTLSIGIAALPDHGHSSRALLDAADSALYRAKKEGRDRVLVAEVRTPNHEVAAVIDREGLNRN